MNRGHIEGSRDESVKDNTAPVQVTRIEISERTLSILALAFSCVAIMGSFWAISEMQRNERESRILQQQVMDQSALMLREGIAQPGDQTNGPAGNTSYRKR